MRLDRLNLLRICKALYAICNSYIDIVPGHVHPRELADIAKEAIREAGGIPF